MFLVHVSSRNLFVFLGDDPRAEGYHDPLMENVSLEWPADIDDPAELDEWPEGSNAPDHFVARHSEDPARFKVFRNQRECQREGFIACGDYHVDGSWASVKGLI